MPDMPIGVTIRRAMRADLPALGRLGALLVSTHHELDRARFMAATAGTPSGYAQYLGSQLAAPNVVLLVATADDQVIGYSYGALEGVDYMALRGPAGALYDIIVDPESRRHGVGAQLLEATVAALQALGAPQVVLSTADRNAAAQRLFERAGFRRTMIEMTRTLDARDR